MAVTFSVNDRAQLYYELGKLVNAGLSLPAAAESILDNQVPRGQREFLTQLVQGLKQSKSIGESVEDIRGLGITKLETSIITATEETGRLGDGFDQLAEYFEMRRNTVREIRGQLVYPAILLHLAVLILIVPAAINKGIGPAVTEALITLGVAYAIIWGLYTFFKNWAARAETSAKADASLNRMPLFGKLRRKLALSRFCFVLRAFVLAGKPFSEAFAAAAESSRSGQLSSHVKNTVVPTIESGDRAGPVLSKQIFTPAFVRAYRTAEEAGSIDEDLKTWGAVFREETSSAFQHLGNWVPKVLYFAVMGFVAWKIVASYMARLNSITDMLN